MIFSTFYCSDAISNVFFYLIIFPIEKQKKESGGMSDEGGELNLYTKQKNKTSNRLNGVEPVREGGG